MNLLENDIDIQRIKQDQDDNTKNIELQNGSIITSFVERLDDEYNKSLQFTDVNSQEYSDRLLLIVDNISLMWELKQYLTSKGYTELSIQIISKIVEQVGPKR